MCIICTCVVPVCAPVCDPATEAIFVDQHRRRVHLTKSGTKTYIGDPWNGRRKIIMTTTTIRYNIIYNATSSYIIIIIVVLFKTEISRIAAQGKNRESQRVKCNILFYSGTSLEPVQNSDRWLPVLSAINENKWRSRTVSIENQPQSPADAREPWLTLLCML